jgi:hypothetical protein
VPNLFEIPPAVPPIGQWSIPDAVEDTTSAKFPTDALAPAGQEGIYQLKVDLFDSSGALVDVTTLGIKYRVPHELDLSAPATIHTDDAAALGLVFDDDGDGKKSFIMTLHVDNNVCSSSLAAPTLNGNPANPCGVMNYDPNAPGSVTMDYTASHPHGFATYTFGLYRGGTLLTPPTVSNQPVGAGSFSTTQTVNYLLGGCPVAGFAEYLNVWALAIDGWRRLSEYDTLTIARGFVLAPDK